MLHAVRLVLLCALVLVGGACGGEDPQPDTAPTQAEPLTLDGRIETAMHALLSEGVRAAAQAAPAFVLDDDTPRIEGREKPKAGFSLVTMPGAVCHVPVAGLERVRLGIDERGLALRLSYGEDELLVLDATGAPATQADMERHRGLAADFWQDAWSDLEAGVREWGQSAGQPGSAVDERLAAYRAGIARWETQFAREHRDLRTLRRAALRADAEAGADPYDLYRCARLLRIKAAMLREVGEDSGLPVAPLAAGPALGILRGTPTAGSEFFARLDGVGDLSVQIHATWSPGAGRILTAAALEALLGSFRPYARSRQAARRLGVEAGGAEAAVAALSALSAFHNAPSAERAQTLLRHLREADPDLDPEAAETTSLVRGLMATAKAPDGEFPAWLRVLTEGD